MPQKLQVYKQKRDFARTPEPSGKKVKKSKKLVYVIQKHFARRLHFDLRLEHKGVLVSWAVTKEPPKESGIRRLAVQTEDHPIEYAKFSGRIAEGNYGAGKVESWDSGNFELIKWRDNEIIFNVKGKKLKGSYALIKLKPTPRFPGKNNWLFFRRKS
jgi:DNA ligase D-like protein (predicted 3'-phosphoesterase)